MALTYNGLNTLQQGYQNALQSPDYYKGLWKSYSEGSTGNGSNWFQNMGGWQGIGTGVASAMDAPYGNTRHGAFDYADPLWHAADGRESIAGNMFSDMGVGMFKEGLSKGNLFEMAGGGITKAVGSLWNSAFGKKWNKDNIAKLDSTIAGMNSSAKGLASADNNSSLISNWNSAPQAFDFNKSYIGKDGWFTHGVSRKFNEYQDKMAEAGANMMHAMNTGVENINKRNRGTIYNSSAFGGPIDTGMSAVDFNFMSDWLASKRDKAAGSGKIGFNYPGLFAYGGGMHNHGADWSNGTTHIDAGGSHSENPNGGVQIGIDREGVPNLVEEGEVIYNDYVYSARIPLDNNTKERFHINRKRDITYAEMAKKLEKESEERPNDPISRKALDVQMAQLAEEQERQKQEQKAAEAQQMFASLSPEEQVGLMQQLQAEEQAAAEQQMAEQQAMQQEAQGMPIQAPVDAAAIQGMPIGQPVAEAPMVGAYGGKLFSGGGSLVNGADVNTFPTGGWLKKQWNNWKNRDKRRTLKQYNEDWFLNQARALGMIGEKDNEIKIKVKGDNGTEEERTFSFDDEDAVANLENFNHLFRMYQRQKALDTYIAGQRQAKLNELLGPNGMYRKSDDGQYYQRATINPADRTIYINKDYVGGDDGFITPEDYAKLSDEDKALYKKRIERAGDRAYDYNGVPVWTTVEGATEDSILEPYISGFSNGFKWNINDSQSLDYPAELRHGPVSGLRYAPAAGGALGLLYNLAKDPDYSRAQEIKDYAMGINPMMISAEYNPTYRTYRPMDPWRQENMLIAASNGTGRAIGNLNSPSRGAMQIANGYNLINGLGNIGIQGLVYNDNLAGQVATHNSGENKTLAQLGLQEQAYNQYGVNNAQKLQYEGIVRGNAMMDDIDARRNAAVNANLTNLMTSLGNIGEEAYDTDKIDYLLDRGVIRSAEGGRINRRKNK